MRSPPKSVIYQKQCVLRVLSPEDGPAIFKAVSESLPALRQFMKWAHFSDDFEKACSVYAEFESKTLKGEEAHFAGFDGESGDFLFCASLVPGSRLNSSAFDLGYWVASKNTGRGIGTLAIQILCVLAFRFYGGDRLSAFVNPENAASLRVIEKCGFQLEGTLRNFLQEPSQEMLANGYSLVRDAFCFSLLPGDISQLSWFDSLHENIVVSCLK